MLARLACLLALACLGPASFAQGDPPSAAFRAEIARIEATLFASDYARSSPEARIATEDYLAALVGIAWNLAEASSLLYEPTFAFDEGIAGRPGLVNPDNRYGHALLDPKGSYRVSGRRGTHAQLLLQVLDGYPFAVLGQSRLVVDTDELGVAPGHDFELFLGGPERGGHWFPLAADARAIIVRMTFSDWERETPSQLSIERLDTPPLEPPASRFARAAEYLRMASTLWMESFMTRVVQAPVNVLPPPAATRDGLVGQYTTLCRFALAPDEVLLVTAPRSAARYQGIQLGDRWFATPHWVRHQSSLSAAQARADADGKLRFVVSPDDPGVPNWLDSAGEREGYVLLRWQGLPAPLAAPEGPSAELVKREALRSRLPAGTPVVDAAGRAQQLAGRRHAPVRR